MIMSRMCKTKKGLAPISNAAANETKGSSQMQRENH
jgi:hypothetical protein